MNCESSTDIKGMLIMSLLPGNEWKWMMNEKTNSELRVVKGYKWFGIRPSFNLFHTNDTKPKATTEPQTTNHKHHSNWIILLSNSSLCAWSQTQNNVNFYRQPQKRSKFFNDVHQAVRHKNDNDNNGIALTPNHKFTF